jgi:hypothetical protein
LQSPEEEVTGIGIHQLIIDDLYLEDYRILGGKRRTDLRFHRGSAWADHPGFVMYNGQTQAGLNPDRFRRKGPATPVGLLLETGSIALIIDY